MTEQKAKEEMAELARYLNFLYDCARAFGVRAIDAEDIAHNAFLDACNRETPLPACPNARKALLCTIVHFRVYTYRNERKRMVRRAELADEYATVIKVPYTRDGGDAVAAKELLELVFPQLSPEQLEVFSTKVLDHLTIREVAAKLGITERKAQSRWERALAKLEMEFESLDRPRRRGVFGLVIFAWISSIISAARNANAMVEWLKGFFRVFMRFGTLPIRALPGVATAAAVLLSPQHPGAYADDVMVRRESAMQSPKAGVVAPIDTSAPGVVVEVARVKPLPPSASRNVSAPRAGLQKKATAEVAPPDHLLTMAILALQRGDPEKALAILDGYAARNSIAGDASAVESLRATAREAIAAKAAATR